MVIVAACGKIITAGMDSLSFMGPNFPWIGPGSRLRYDDLYDGYYDLDVKEVLDRLPREIVDARNQRVKHAMDLFMKHEYLPENL